MSQPLQPYRVLLFINGQQCGDNQTFKDWYAHARAAIARMHPDDQDVMGDFLLEAATQGAQRQLYAAPRRAWLGSPADGHEAHFALSLRVTLDSRAGHDGRFTRVIMN